MPERRQIACDREAPAVAWRIRAPQGPAELEAYYRLRWRLLRAPWGQPPGSERDEFEELAVHRLVCDLTGRVLGVGRLHCAGGEARHGQIRYMAVDPQWRGQGLGRQLLAALEAAAVRQGLERIDLNAREEAVDFYARQGYAIVGESHILYGAIRHMRMTKALASAERVQ